jgi:hypothetical protein
MPPSERHICRRGTERKSAYRALLFGNSPLDKFPLKLREACL